MTAKRVRSRTTLNVALLLAPTASWLGFLASCGVSNDPGVPWPMEETPEVASTERAVVEPLTEADRQAARTTASSLPAPALVYNPEDHPNLSGSYEVTDQGALKFELPLMIPPAPEVNQVSLKLRYVSSARNADNYGYGWGLVGAGEPIVECPRTRLEDGVRSSSGGLSFCLGGKKLVETTTSNEYSVKGSRHTRVVRHSWSVWSVYDPSGHVTRYDAAHPNSAKYQDGVEVAWYPVWKEFGNVRTDFTYRAAPARPGQLDKIEYADARITFSYEPVIPAPTNDLFKQYRNGTELSRDLVRRVIISNTTGSESYYYEWDYGTLIIDNETDAPTGFAEVRRTITRIRRCTSAVSCTPDLVLNYDQRLSAAKVSDAGTVQVPNFDPTQDDHFPYDPNNEPEQRTGVKVRRPSANIRNVASLIHWGIDIYPSPIAHDLGIDQNGDLEIQSTDSTTMPPFSDEKSLFIDVDGDGVAEVFHKNDNLWLVDAATGLVGANIPVSALSQGQVVDVDGDGDVEGYICHRNSGTRKWPGYSSRTDYRGFRTARAVEYNPASEEFEDHGPIYDRLGRVMFCADILGITDLDRNGSLELVYANYDLGDAGQTLVQRTNGYGDLYTNLSGNSAVDSSGQTQTFDYGVDIELYSIPPLTLQYKKSYRLPFAAPMVSQRTPGYDTGNGNITPGSTDYYITRTGDRLPTSSAQLQNIFYDGKCSTSNKQDAYPPYVSSMYTDRLRAARYFLTDVNGDGYVDIGVMPDYETCKVDAARTFGPTGVVSVDEQVAEFDGLGQTTANHTYPSTRRIQCSIHIPLELGIRDTVVHPEYQSGDWCQNNSVFKRSRWDRQWYKTFEGAELTKPYFFPNTGDGFATKASTGLFWQDGFEMDAFNLPSRQSDYHACEDSSPGFAPYSDRNAECYDYVWDGGSPQCVEAGPGGVTSQVTRWAPPDCTPSATEIDAAEHALCGVLRVEYQPHHEDPNGWRAYPTARFDGYQLGNLLDEESTSGARDQLNLPHFSDVNGDGYADVSCPDGSVFLNDRKGAFVEQDEERGLNAVRAPISPTSYIEVWPTPGINGRYAGQVVEFGDGGLFSGTGSLSSVSDGDGEVFSVEYGETVQDSCVTFISTTTTDPHDFYCLAPRGVVRSLTFRPRDSEDGSIEERIVYSFHDEMRVERAGASLGFGTRIEKHSLNSQLVERRTMSFDDRFEHINQGPGYTRRPYPFVNKPTEVISERFDSDHTFYQKRTVAWEAVFVDEELVVRPTGKVKEEYIGDPTGMLLERTGEWLMYSTTDPYEAVAAEIKLSGSGDCVKTTFEYENRKNIHTLTNAKYNVGLVTENTVSHGTCSNGSDFVADPDDPRVVQHTYHPDLPLISATRSLVGTPFEVLDEKTYDSNHNPEVIRKTAVSSGVFREEYSVWDGHGLSVVYHVDAGGYETYTNQDPFWGAIHAIQDDRGQVTQFVHDVYLRQRRVTYPDGRYTETTIHPYSDLFLPKAVRRSVTQESSRTGAVEEYTDVHGRPIRSCNPTFSGTACRDFSYDRFGNQSFVTDAFFAGSPAPTSGTGFEFFADGRKRREFTIDSVGVERTTQTLTRFPGGNQRKILRSTPSGLTQIDTLEPNGLRRWKSQKTWTEGAINRSQPELEFSYTRTGKIDEVRGPTGTLLYDATYNVAGYEQSVSRIGHGPQLFTYNAFGQIVSSEDDLGWTDVSYDAIGRQSSVTVTPKIHSGQWQASFTYGSPGSAASQDLVSAQAGGSLLNYGYDAFGRRTYVEHQIGLYGTPMTDRKDTTYNANGQVDSVVFSSVGMGSGISLQKHYDPVSGALSSVADSSSTPLFSVPVFTLGAVEPDGKPSSATVAGLDVQWYHHQVLGTPTQIKVEDPSTSQVYYNELGSYDVDGRLRSTFEAVDSRAQVFGYDGLGRLRRTLRGTSAPAGGLFASPDDSVLCPSCTPDETFDFDSNGRPVAWGLGNIADPPSLVAGSPAVYDASGVLQNVGAASSIESWSETLLMGVTTPTADFDYIYDASQRRLGHLDQYGNGTVTPLGGVFRRLTSGTVVSNEIQVFSLGEVSVEATEILGGLRAYEIAVTGLDRKLGVTVDSSGGRVAHDFSAYGDPIGTPPSFGPTPHMAEEWHFQEQTALSLTPTRAFDPAVRLFSQPDPLVWDKSDPRAYLSYGHPMDDPINIPDPSGLKPEFEGCGADDCIEAMGRPLDPGWDLDTGFESIGDLAWEGRDRLMRLWDPNLTIEGFLELLETDPSLARIIDNLPLSDNDKAVMHFFAWTKGDVEVRRHLLAAGIHPGSIVVATGSAYMVLRAGKVYKVARSAVQARMGKVTSLLDEAKEAVNVLYEMAARGAHGNSRLSTKAQHGYEIVDTTTGEVVKTGVSGGRRTAAGGSARANSQANRWNREAGEPGRYEPRVVQEVPAGPGARQQILEWETENAARLREAGQLRDRTKHVRP